MKKINKKNQLLKFFSAAVLPVVLFIGIFSVAMAQLENGQECGENSHCKSDYCDPAGICATAPAPSGKVAQTLQMGASGNDVKILQQALLDKLNDSAILQELSASSFNPTTRTWDGIFGDKTKKAVQAYQQQEGLSPTGIADQSTLTKLGIWGGTGADENKYPCSAAASSSQSACSASNGFWIPGYCGNCGGGVAAKCSASATSDPAACSASGGGWVPGKCSACASGGTPPASNNNPSADGKCPEGLQWNAKASLCMLESPFTGDTVAGSSSLADLIKKIVDYFLFFAGMVAVVFIVVGGFWYVTSAGNEEQAEKGRTALINAIIGLIVVIMSFAIVTVISNLITKGPDQGNSPPATQN